MHLKQSFETDFDLLIAGLLPGYEGEPYAFVRFGDGESAIIQGNFYQTKADGWRYPGGDSEISGALSNSLSCNDRGYCIGLPSPTFESHLLSPLLDLVRVDRSRITYAKIFTDNNFKRWRAIWPTIKPQVVTVGPENCDFTVTPFGVNPFVGFAAIDVIVEDLLSVRQPILVSAGPLANIIIHRYWQQQYAIHRQVIIDIGSAIDEYTKGYRARKYSTLHHNDRDWNEPLDDLHGTSRDC